uniref:TNFR-Cys domain-containing protein n=3 Tax=Macrostomum lignano TaxID=282301 RepID=A0A1I8HAD3_9PLAT
LRSGPDPQVSGGRPDIPSQKTHPQPLPGGAEHGSVLQLGSPPQVADGDFGRAVPHSAADCVPQQQGQQVQRPQQVEWHRQVRPDLQVLDLRQRCPVQPVGLAHRGQLGEGLGHHGHQQVDQHNCADYHEGDVRQEAQQLQGLQADVAGGARLQQVVFPGRHCQQRPEQRLEHRPVRLEVGAGAGHHAVQGDQQAGPGAQHHQEDRGKVQHVLQHPAQRDHQGAHRSHGEDAQQGEGVPEAHGNAAGQVRLQAIQQEGGEGSGEVAEAGAGEAGGLRADQSGHVEAGGAHAGADVGAVRQAGQQPLTGGAEAGGPDEGQRQAGQIAGNGKVVQQPEEAGDQGQSARPQQAQVVHILHQVGEHEDEEQSLQRQLASANPGGAGRAADGRLGDAVAEVAGGGDPGGQQGEADGEGDGVEGVAEAGALAQRAEARVREQQVDGRQGVASGSGECQARARAACGTLRQPLLRPAAAVLPGPVQHELSGLVRQRLPQFQVGEVLQPAQPILWREGVQQQREGLLASPAAVQQQHQRAAAPEADRQQELPRQQRLQVAQPAHQVEALLKDVLAGRPECLVERRDQRRQEALGVQPAQARVLAQRSAQRAAAGGQAVRERQPLASLPHQVAHQLGVAAQHRPRQRRLHDQGGRQRLHVLGCAPRRLVGGLEGGEVATEHRLQLLLPPALHGQDGQSELRTSLFDSVACHNWRMRRSVSGCLLFISLVQQLPTAQSNFVRNAPCGEVDLQDQYRSLSYARLTSLCPAKQFCCYPAGGSQVATCCDDCTREVDFNPTVQPSDCLSGQRKWSMVLITLLPVLTALLPGMVAVTAVLILSMVSRNRVDL